MSRLTDDELFKDLNRTERSEHAREETLEKLHKRIGQKRRHIFPVFLSGVLAAAAILLLTFFLFDSNFNQSIQQGEFDDGVEQVIFEGSGGDWFAEYELTQRSVDGEMQQSMRYILTYRGFDIPEKVDYKIRLPDGSVESGSDVPFGLGKAITGAGTCECNLTSDDEPIKVSVSWNGTIDLFDLKEKVLVALPISGAGESWSFTSEPGGFGEKDKFVIKYIGEGQAPNMIDYEVEGVLGATGGTGHDLDDGQLVKQGDLQNLEIYREDQEVEISIKWEGQSESFIASPNE